MNVRGYNQTPAIISGYDAIHYTFNKPAWPLNITIRPAIILKQKNISKQHGNDGKALYELFCE